MSSFEFDVDEFLRSLNMSDQKVRKAAEQGMHDVTDDLLRTANDTAPVDYGILRKSGSKSVGWKGDTVVGEVAYSVKEGTTGNKNGETKTAGSFNYALWTHEQTYNLGEQSRLSPGTQGMSGKHYSVGNKYLERPLKGESDAYKEHIAKTIRKELS